MTVKLVIWDLDDTLWAGTLAEGDELVLKANRVEFVLALNQRGVVNSICSKNLYAPAKAALEGFGLWQEFVFPEIKNEPKGPLVKSIIADMQLRAPDVIFIDDIDSNLREVAFFNEGIQILDANDPETDNKLAEWINELAPGKSRVDEYRHLETKRDDREAQSQTNEEFLATCDIKVAMIRGADNLRFAPRIEELINRTNQMNFTKSRVEPGSLADYLVDPLKSTYSIFVWDKYGFYGLVGFSAVESENNLIHLAFSCRIMNMGVEQAVGKVLQEKFKDIQLPHNMFESPWIKFVDPDSLEFRSLLDEELKPEKPIGMRVMANCQSGAIVHHLGLKGVEFDNWPRIFRLREMIDTPDILQPQNVYVYGAFNDYANQYWGEPPTVEVFSSAIENLVLKAEEYGALLIVVLPTQNFPNARRHGVTPERFLHFNEAWRELQNSSDYHFELIEVGNLQPEEVEDPRHFGPELLREIAQVVKELAAAKLGL